MRALILILLLGCSEVWAGDLVINTFSKHYTSASGYNESNFGLGYQTNHVELGCFKNTYYSTSCYAGKRFDWDDGVSFNVGAIDHPDTNLYFSLKYERRYWQVGVSAMIAFIQLKIPIK